MKLYIFNQNPNGTSDLLITDNHDQVVDSISAAIFGNIPPANFGWSGDGLKGITACYYGESVNYIEATDESYNAVVNNEYGDIQQVVEVNLDDVLERIATSPVNDGSETLAKIKSYFKRGA